MARPIGPIIPPNDPRECAPWLNKELRKIGLALRQHSTGLAAIVRGEVPDGSGNPITPGLGDYFFKPGLPGGQTGYGATEPSGWLVLGSTRDATRGKIYLGASLLGVVFDEGQSLLGLNISPAATFHIVGSTAGVVSTITPSSDVNTNWETRGGVAWAGIGGTRAAAMATDDGVTTMATIQLAVGGTNPQHCGLSGTIAPGGIYTVTLRVATLGSAPTTASFGCTLVDSAGNGFSDVFGAADGTVTAVTEILTPSPTFYTITRTVRCTGTPAITGSTPNSIKLTASAFVGVSDLYMGFTSLVVTQIGSALIRWDLASGSQSGGVDIAGRAGINTGSAALDSELTVIPDAVATVGVKVKATAAQTGDLIQLTNSGGTALGGRTAAGAPYLVAGAAADALLVSDASGVGSWQSLVSYEDEPIFYEDSPVYV